MSLSISWDPFQNVPIYVAMFVFLFFCVLRRFTFFGFRFLSRVTVLRRVVGVGNGSGGNY